MHIGIRQDLVDAGGPGLTARVVAINPFRHLQIGLLRALGKTDALVVCDGRGTPQGDVSTTLASLIESGARRLAVFADPELSPSQVPENVIVVLQGPEYNAMAWSPRLVLAQVTELEEARRAIAAGVSGLIAKGAESGDRIGDTSAFILFQQLVREVSLPIWVQGGIGLNTAAACIAGGAAGVVIDAQLALVKESTLPDTVRHNGVRLTS